MKSGNTVKLGFPISPCVTSLDWEFPLKRKWNSCFDDPSYVILESNETQNDPRFVHWISKLAYLLYNLACIEGDFLL